MELRIRIVGEHLREVDFGERGVGEARSRLFLGIQKGEDVIDRLPVDSETATFEADFTVSPLPDGKTNFLGPYAHGPRASRFCYLCWLEDDRNGTTTRFSRIKIPLTLLPWERVEAAAHAGTTIEMRFSLVGKNGGPVCASVPAASFQILPASGTEKRLSASG